VRKKWKLAALAFLAIAVCLLLIAPLATIEVKVDLPPATTTASPETVNQAATWIVTGIAIALTLIVLGVLGWVARHILRRREPDA
jgi:heme/copper-type cytochrome/quinol oxidase subunit 2